MTAADTEKQFMVTAIGLILVLMQVQKEWFSHEAEGPEEYFVLPEGAPFAPKSPECAIFATECQVERPLGLPVTPPWVGRRCYKHRRNGETMRVHHCTHAGECRLDRVQPVWRHCYPQSRKCNSREDCKVDCMDGFEDSQETIRRVPKTMYTTKLRYPQWDKTTTCCVPVY